MISNTEMPQLVEDPGFFVGHLIRVVALVENPEFFATCFVCPEVTESDGYFTVVQPLFAPAFRVLVFNGPQLVTIAATPTPAPAAANTPTPEDLLIQLTESAPQPTVAEEFIVPDKGLFVFIHGIIREPFIEVDGFGVRTRLPVIEWERLQVFFTNDTWGLVLQDAQTFFLDLPEEEGVGALIPTSQEELEAVNQEETYPFRFKTATHAAPVILQARVVTVNLLPNRGVIVLEVNSQNFGVSNPDTIISLPFPDAPIQSGHLIRIWGSLQPHKSRLEETLSFLLNGPWVTAEGYEILGTLPQAPPSVIDVLDLLPETPPLPVTPEAEAP